jgi:hypothetical protein
MIPDRLLESLSLWGLSDMNSEVDPIGWTGIGVT